MGKRRNLPPPDLSESTLKHWKGYLYVDTATGMVLSRVGNPTMFGHERVWYDGKETYSHRMVWEVINGPIPPGLTINHLDCDPANNRIENLELATQAEQVAHTIKMGRKGPNNRKPGPVFRTKLTHADVQRLKDAPRGTVQDVAKSLGISRTYGYGIRQGRIKLWLD